VKRIGAIAVRDFLATVTTRGFIIAVLLLPALLALTFTIGPRLMNQRSEQVRGQVVVIDRSGAVAPELQRTLTPAAISARRDESARRALASAPPEVRDLADQSGSTTPSALDRITGTVPELHIVERSAADGDAGLRAAKAWLNESTPAARHVAVIVIHADAVRAAADHTEFGGYDLYIPQNLDDRIETVLFEGVRDALVDARAAAQGLDRKNVDAITLVPKARSITVTKDGERATLGAFNRLLPFAFVGMLLFSVLLGGQGLVSSTVEEKSSRVIEVLLSAVSPFELLAGKILGQMGVSLVILGVYITLAFMMLASLAIFGLLDLSLVVYLLIFFVITFLTFGAGMAAVGSAVNDMREAQALMMPILLVMMVPWMLAAPIAREPNSTFSTIISFVPPVNAFAMLLRLTSSAPPPGWQVAVTIAIGLVAVVASIWCAAKIFTIGLLMYGKPPDLKTLVRWIREA
jgi:ABC-2 type transport system permease protein